MLLALALFAFIVLALTPRLIPLFLGAPYLTSVIAITFLIGVVACFYQIYQLTQSVAWINAYSQGNLNKARGTPLLLAPLAVMMRGYQLPSGMSTASARSILDSVSIRLTEIRDITRYIVNVLIFLGLLGTFYGLALTIPGVRDTIHALTQGENANAGNVFGELMSGLERQLGGMGTAFGSSLLGLGSSLMVGLLELFAGHGQNRFYREFEEWISRFTSVGLAETGGLDLALDPNEDAPLARAFSRLNDSLLRLDQRLSEQTGSIEKLDELFGRIEAGLRESQSMSGDMRNAVRSLEAQLVRMSEDMNVSRDTSTRELRRDLVAINQSLREIIKIQE